MFFIPFTVYGADSLMQLSCFALATAISLSESMSVNKGNSEEKTDKKCIILFYCSFIDMNY